MCSSLAPFPAHMRPAYWSVLRDDFANTVPGFPRKLGQRYCPNHEIAKLFPITQARTSPRRDSSKRHLPHSPALRMRQSRRRAAQAPPKSDRTFVTGLNGLKRFFGGTKGALCNGVILGEKAGLAGFRRGCGGLRSLSLHSPRWQWMIFRWWTMSACPHRLRWRMRSRRRHRATTHRRLACRGPMRRRSTNATLKRGCLQCGVTEPRCIPTARAAALSGCDYCPLFRLRAARSDRPARLGLQHGRGGSPWH